MPACVPYFEGCTSISSAGRYGISYYLFKVGMVCGAVLLVLFWRGMAAHIRAATGKGAPVVALTGTGGAVFLVLYTAFLGSEGDFYFLMRRFGSLLYFGLTMLAQLMALRRLETFAPRWLTGTMKWTCFSMLFFRHGEHSGNELHGQQGHVSGRHRMGLFFAHAGLFPAYGDLACWHP